MIAVNLAENVLVEHRWVNIFYSSRAERILAGTSLNGLFKEFWQNSSNIFS